MHTLVWFYMTSAQPLARAPYRHTFRSKTAKTATGRYVLYICIYAQKGTWEALRACKISKFSGGVPPRPPSHSMGPTFCICPGPPQSSRQPLLPYLGSSYDFSNQQRISVQTKWMLHNKNIWVTSPCLGHLSCMPVMCTWCMIKFIWIKVYLRSFSLVFLSAIFLEKLMGFFVITDLPPERFSWLQCYGRNGAKYRSPENRQCIKGRILALCRVANCARPTHYKLRWVDHICLSGYFTVAFFELGACNLRKSEVFFSWVTNKLCLQ